MARRKKRSEESSGGGAGWLNTFADLMNLLLCFFVLLFSMSNVDADKYEAIVTSLSNSIDVFDGGAPAVGSGAFVSSGADQMVSVAQFFNKFEESGSNSKDKNQNQSSSDPQNKSQQSTSNKGDSESAKVQQYREKIEQEQKERTEALYEEVYAKATESNVADVINVNMDSQYQYVQISLKGAVLFDSGKADIKGSAFPVLNKIGDILKLYSKNLVKVEGHTDNVPILSSPKYRNNMELSTARATSVFVYMVKNKGLNPKRIEAAGRGEYIPVASNSTEDGRAKNRRIEIKIYTTQ